MSSKTKFNQDDIIILPSLDPNNQTMADSVVIGHGDTITIDLNTRAGATTSVWPNDTLNWADATITLDSDNPWKPAKVELKFDLDPLAITLYLRSKGMEDYQICAELMEKTPSYSVEEVAPFIPEANEIREYFKAKLVTAALKGTQPTPFRKDLGKVLTSDTFTTDLIPIVVRLQAFYAEDLVVEGLVEDLTHLPRELAIGGTKFTKSLHFVTRYERFRKAHKTYRYVFKDAANHMYVISVGTDNVIAGVFDYICRHNNRLTISGNRAYNKLLGYDFGYYEVTKVQLEDE